MRRSLLLIWSSALVALLLINLPWIPSQATPHTPQALDGRQVFLAKGCFSCHTHARVGTSPISMGPSLTSYQGEQDFLRQWLRDPQAMRPGSLMPNLQLSSAEIEALIVFLNSSE